MGCFRVLFLVFLFSVSHAAESDDSDDDDDYRLDGSVIPIHYDLEITPYLMEDEAKDEEQFTFDGKVQIQLRATKANIKEIVLHADNLTITSSELLQAGRNSKRILITVSDPDEETDQFTVKLTRPLIRGINYLLTFEFTGPITDDNTGIFRSSYKNEDDEDVWMASAYFEKGYAREAFPCFDEPKFKSTFTLKINRHNNYNSYSNTELDYSTAVEGEERTIDVFKKTPKISTSHLGFHITDIDVLNEDDDEFSILALSKFRESADYIHARVLAILKGYEDFIDYPYDSIDDISEFHLINIGKSGRDWLDLGLIYLNEFWFNFDPETANWKKEYLDKIIAEELGEIWFGNLVTSEWWSYNWINEGLRYNIKYLVLEELLDDYDADENFVDQRLDVAFDYKNGDFGFIPDHALTTPTDLTLEEYKESEIFLCFYKAPAIIRMFGHALGADNFKDAIRTYVKDNAFKSVTDDDFEKALNSEWENSDVDFATLFDDWTKQSGYPIVTIDLAEDGKSFEISQAEYLLDTSETSDKKWIIPIAYTTDDEKDFENTTPDVYLGKDEPLTVELDESADWVIANIQQTGYYRVNYNDDDWDRIGEALKTEDFGGIHHLNRAQIVRDLIDFGNIGLLDYKRVLDFLTYLDDETFDDVWYEAVEEFSYIGIRLNDEDFDLFKKYMQSIMEKYYDSLDIEDLDDKDGFDGKDEFIRAACFYSISDCIEEANKVVDEYLSEKEGNITRKIEAAIVASVHDNSEKYFDDIFELLKEDNDHAVYLTACTSDESELQTLMEYIIESDDINNEAAQFRFILDLECARDDVVFDYVVEHYNEICKEDTSTYLIGDIVYNLARAVDTEEQLEKFNEFLDENRESFKVSDKKIEWMKNYAKSNLKWHQDMSPPLLAYLKKNFGDGDESDESDELGTTQDTPSDETTDDGDSDEDVEEVGPLVHFTNLLNQYRNPSNLDGKKNFTLTEIFVLMKKVILSLSP